MSKTNKKKLAIPLVLLVLAGGIAGTGVVISSNDNLSKPHAQNLSPEEIKKEEEYKAARKTMQNVFSILPQDSTQVVHTNFFNAESPKPLWDHMIKLSPATVFKNNNAGIPESMLKDIRSITYASFPGYIQQAEKKTPATAEPFASALVLTASRDKVSDLSDQMHQKVEQNNSNVVSFIPGQSEIGYVVIFTNYAQDTMMEVLLPYLNDSMLELKDEPQSFASTPYLDDFDVRSKTPSMYYSISGFFDTLTPFNYDSKDTSSNAKIDNFMKDFKKTGLGFENNEDVVWFGHLKESSKEKSTWEGKIVSGKVETDSVDIAKMNDIYDDQIELVPLDGKTEEELEEIRKKGGVAFSHGTFLSGMSILSEAVSIAKQDQVSGVVDFIANDLQEAKPIDKKEKLTLKYAPRLVIGMFTGYDNLHQTDYITWRFNEENVTLEIDNHINK